MISKEWVQKNIEINGGFYGYMYGSPWIFCGSNEDKLHCADKIIFLENGKNVYVKDDCIVYIYGWPGPDGNIYYYKDYNKTWAFNERAIEKSVPPDGLCKCSDCIFQPMSYGPGCFSLPEECPRTKGIINRKDLHDIKDDGYCAKGIQAKNLHCWTRYRPRPHDLCDIIITRRV